MITAQARAAARAAYRAIFRATAITFTGDHSLLQAFRSQTRQAYLANRISDDPQAYAAAIKHAEEVAQVLRKNVAQAAETENGVWRLRITKDTELGENDTVKKRGSYSTFVQPASRPRAFSTSSPASKSIPMSKVNPKLAAHLARQIPVLREEDLEESFVRGSGPGGQAINKTSSSVSLIHKPSGIRVQAQPTRSREENRRFARRILLEKLDQHLNPGLSKTDLKWDKLREKKRRRAKKARKKQKALACANVADESERDEGYDHDGDEDDSEDKDKDDDFLLQEAQTSVEDRSRERGTNGGLTGMTRSH